MTHQLTDAVPLTNVQFEGLIIHHGICQKPCPMALVTRARTPPLLSYNINSAFPHALSVT